MSMQSLTLLGATGSIGQNTLEVIEQHPEAYQLFAVTAATNYLALQPICQRHQPRYAVLCSETAAQALRAWCAATGCPTEVLCGDEALAAVSRADAVDIVLAAIVGAAGLGPTLAAIEAGKKVLLANKEALIMAGPLMMAAAKKSGATLMPIDSEHNAAFQCMPSGYMVGATPEGVSQIYLTASGGAVRELTVEQLRTVTPQIALQHPVWRMGPKITIDSATMVNKGLEVMEASYLFNLPPKQIEVLLHPQGVVHALVAYRDGSFLAQMGAADMRIPIACGLSWPERLSLSTPSLDFTALAALTFSPVCTQKYPALALAYHTLETAGTAPAIFNAANEVAVDAFLNERISYLQITQIIDACLQQTSISLLETIEQVIAVDQCTRDTALSMIQQL